MDNRLDREPPTRFALHVRVGQSAEFFGAGLSMCLGDGAGERSGQANNGRGPAILAEEYDVWVVRLGRSEPAEEARLLRKTAEGVTWRTFPKVKKPRALRKAGY